MVQEDTEKTKAKRAFYAIAIKRAHDDFEKSENWSSAEFEVRVGLLQANFEKFEMKHIQMESCGTISSEMKTELIEIEQMMIKLKARMCAAIKNSEGVHANTQYEKCAVAAEKSKVSEPRMQIEECVFEEKFSGDRHGWLQFKRHFLDQVGDNANVSESIKLSVLMKACPMEIAAILTMENEYSKAWERLTKMFENAYGRALYAMRSIGMMPKLQAVSGICSLVCNINKVVQVLEDGDLFATFDHAIAIMAITKMDNDTYRMWERQQAVLAESWAQSDEASNTPRKALEYIPSWQSVKDFLMSEAELSNKQSVVQAEQINATKESETSYAQVVTQKSEHAYVTSVQALAEAKKNQAEFLQCTLCDGIHPKFKCDIFLQMQLCERLDHVKKYVLCCKCLRYAHQGPCTQKTCNQPCPSCKPGQVYHNSLLCPTKWTATNATKTQWQGDESWDQE